MGYGIPKILRVTKFQICKFACCCLIANLFVIFVLRYAIKHNYFPQSEWLLWILPVFITMGLIILSHVKFLHLLLNPVSYMIESGRTRKKPM